MMDCMMGAGCGWMMWAMWLFWIFLVALLAGGLWRLFATRRGGPPPPGGTPRETPRETLDRRYADGDISTQEYEERRRKLGE